VEKDNYSSYTIRIKTGNELYDTENLIIEQKDSLQNAFILSYNFDSDWVIENINGIHSKPRGKVYYSKYDGSNLNTETSSISSRACYDVTITVTVPCPCVGHYFLNGCSCYQKATTYITTYSFCDGDSEDGTDLFPSDGGDPSGAGAGGGDPIPSDPDDTSETQMNLEDMAEFIEFKIDKVIYNLELDSTQVGWIFNGDEDNIQKTLDIYDYGSAKRWSDEAKDFGNLAFEFLRVNSQFSFLQYENWFSSNYPDLTPIPFEIIPEDITYDTPIIQQALPTFSSFLSNFPKLGASGNYSEMPTSQVYNLVGGSLLNSHLNQPTAYSNACSIRGSRGLLYSGVEIPVLRYNALQRTQKGADNNNYVLDAVSFDKFMIDKFGETTHKLEGVDANNPVKIANLLNGKNGIYVIINNSYQQAGYSGHVDTIINGICISNAYTMPPGGVKSIRIWELN